MRRVALWLAVALAAVVVPTAGAAAVSPHVRMTIVHVVHGCHSWGKADSTPTTPRQVVRLRKGARLDIRVNCPMDFRFTQRSGPRLKLGNRVTHSGTVRTIVFAKAGVYKLRAVSVQTSAEMGLQTLGPDNVLLLTVRVGR